MTVHKQMKLMHPLYIAKLDNGVTIQVYGDYALGDDGKTYYHVGSEDADGVMQTLCWSCEIEGALVT